MATLNTKTVEKLVRGKSSAQMADALNADVKLTTGPKTSGQGNVTSISSAGPGLVGRTIMRAGALTMPVSMVAFIPPFIPEGLSKGLAWAGKLPSFAGAPFRFAARVVVKPTQIVNSEQALHEVGTTAVTKLKNVAGVDVAPAVNTVKKWFGANLVNKIGNTTINRSVMNSVHYTTQAVMGYQALSVIGEGNRVMRHMYENITGQKTGIWFPLQILFNRLPEAMHEVRRQYMANIGPRTALSAVIIGASELFNRSNTSGIVRVMGMGLQVGAVGVQTGSIFFATQNNLLNAYPALVMAQEHGETITMGGYFALLKHALPQNTLYSDYQMAQVAKQYETENTLIGKVMQELSNGKFTDRISHVQKFKAVAETQTLPVPVQEVTNEVAKPVTVGRQTFAPKANAGFAAAQLQAENSPPVAAPRAP